MTAGTIVVQSPESSLVTVTKSAERNMLMTPSTAITKEAIGSSDELARVNVAGPPTDEPTVNFIARGFGVTETVTVIPWEATR